MLFSALQSHHHEEEKRALRGEIIVLNNHLMEAKITINKLREDNVSVSDCLVWDRQPQIWTLKLWGHIHRCRPINQSIRLDLKGVREACLGGCFHSVNSFSPHTSAKLPKKVRATFSSWISVLQWDTAERVRPRPLGTWGRLYQSLRATSGASRIRSQGHVEQNGHYVCFCFEVISLICPQGSLRDGFDFSLWSVVLWLMS